MNRRIATWAVAALAIFGLTACGGSPSTPPAAPSPDPTTSAPAPTTEPATEAAPETTPAEQTLAQDCLEPNAKLIEASAQLMEVSAALSASDGKDAKAMVDALKGMGESFGTIAESTTNPEVKEALTGIAKGYAQLAKAYGKMLIDNDLSAAADAMRALADVQESMEAFQKLCSA